MTDDKKFKISNLLTMQSEQLNKFLDKIEIKIPKLVENASVDDKLKFYAKVNAMYTDKRKKLRQVM